MNEPQTVPAGWYATQLPGEERWWDGGAWTSHTRPTPTTQQAAPSPRTELPRGSKEGSLIMAIFAAVLVIPASLTPLLVALTAGNSIFGVLVACLPALILAAGSVYAFMSFLRIKREQDEARAAYMASVTQAPTAADQEPPAQG